MTATERLKFAANELAGYASYAEIVNGISVNRQAVRKYCDEVFAALRALEAEEDANEPGPEGTEI